MSWSVKYFRRYKDRFDAMKPYIEAHNKIVDLGMGAGGYYRGVDVKEIVGIDTNGVLCKRAEEFNSNIKTFKRDVTKTELPDKEFSLVVLSHIIEHFDDYQPLIDEAKRICKDDGYFLIGLPQECYGHYHFHPVWTKKDIIELSNKFGELVEIKDLKDNWVIYVAKTRKIT